jgi:protein-tyrosine-phosphatase
MVKSIERPKNILVVCTGNICRSPMAEGILRALLKGNAGVSVSSAGTHALTGNPATEYAVIAAGENGIDISGHRARMIDEKIIRASSIILCMEPYHIEHILEIDVSADLKTFNLAEFSGPGKKSSKIPDPYGCSLREYRECFKDIDKCIRKFLASEYCLAVEH